MLDPRDEAYDRRLARHLVSLYYQSEEKMEEEYMDMAVLRDYIAYARSYINPRLSEEASQALIEVKELLLIMFQVLVKNGKIPWYVCFLFIYNFSIKSIQASLKMTSIYKGKKVQYKSHLELWSLAFRRAGFGSIILKKA